MFISRSLLVVDGSWSGWGEWSPCSVTCGNGTQQRSRVCNEPAPDNGGLDCPDSGTENRTCTEKTCPGNDRHVVLCFSVASPNFIDV